VTPALRPGVRRTDLDESLRRLTTLVSPLTGVVRSVEELLNRPGDPRLARFSAESADGEQLLAPTKGRIGGGAHVSRKLALAAAIGESVERYSASHVPDGELVLATAADLDGEAVDPARFALFADEQYSDDDFGFGPFTATTPVQWVAGISLPDGARAFLPVQLVHLNWREELPAGETRIGYSSSNGTACAPSFEEAVLGALLELVERDAFMLAWYARLSLPRLDWSASDELVELDRRHFAPTRMTYEAIDLSRFLDVPTVLGIARARGGGETVTFGIGASSAPSVETAWRKALTEALCMPELQQRFVREGPKSFLDDFSDIFSVDDHVAFYVDPAHAGYFAFLDASASVVPIGDVAPLEGANVTAHIEAILRRLDDRGYSAYAVDMTTPDVREAGLHVVKAVVPELCALDFPYRWRFLGGKRMRRTAFELGLLPAPLETGDLNPYPHPFP